MTDDEAQEHKEPLDATDLEKDRNLKLYSIFFDRWIKIGDERIDTSKYFITLLFVNTLVAVLGWVIGTQRPENLSSGFSRTLLIAVFMTGAAISLTWFFRVYPLNMHYAAQRQALLDMEKDLLLPFKGLSKSGNS